MQFPALGVLQTRPPAISTWTPSMSGAMPAINSFFANFLPSGRGALLDRYNNKTHRCNPSYQTLAGDTGYDRRQVMRAAAELRRHGWISISSGKSKLPSNDFEFAWIKIGVAQTETDYCATIPAELTPKN